MPSPTTNPSNHHPLSRLRKLRERARLSLEDLARDCDCTRGAVQRWEAGVAEPTRAYRDAYARALGISVAKLGSIVYAESCE